MNIEEMTKEELVKYYGDYFKTVDFEIEPLLYPDFKDVPADKPYEGRSFAKKSPKKQHFSVAKDKAREEKGEAPFKGKKKPNGGTTRIWQMDDADKPRRKTNGTTRPNTKAPRGRRPR